MPNIAGLSTALSGMNAQRRILDVTAHNIANQTTEGYHRQRVDLAPAGIGTAAAVFAGRNEVLRGVNVEGTTRSIDQLAATRAYQEGSARAGTQVASEAMQRIELAFPEPSELGLGAKLDAFWTSWGDLAVRPDDVTARSRVLSEAQQLVGSMKRAANDLDSIVATTRQEIERLGEEVNDLAARVGQLNSAIAGSPNEANDLIDRRDLLVRRLGELTGATVRPSDGGQVAVSIGGRALVDGPNVFAVDGSGGELRWAQGGAAVEAGPSRARSLREVIDTTVPTYRSGLDDLAATLVTDVNALHSVGYDPSGATGWNFFDPAGVTVDTLQLSVDVAGRPDRLAAGAPVLPGPMAPGPLDGGQAAAIAALVDSATGADVGYRSFVADLGVATRSAIDRDRTQGIVADAARDRAESVSGVSLDEEMVTLVAAQRAYEANARVLTVVDQMLGVLIERTGLVGR